jgi:hypothetical protein
MSSSSMALLPLAGAALLSLGVRSNTATFTGKSLFIRSHKKTDQIGKEATEVPNV